MIKGIGFMFRKPAIVILFAILAVSGFARNKAWIKVAESLPTRPDGAFVRLYPDQTFQLFAVGSAAYEKDADNDDLLRVEQQASMKARAELIKFIQQELSAADSIRDSYKKAEAEVSVNGTADKQSNMISEQNFLSQIRSSSSMMVKGIVSLRVIAVPKGNGGIVKVLVGVSPITRQTAAAAQTPAVPQQPNPAGSGNTVSGPQKAVSVWIECSGRGNDRDAAVKAALIEGIQQVFGVYLENEETLKKRFDQLKNNNTVSTQKSTAQVRNTLTRSKGFIREYRIISVVQTANLQEAKVKAWIVNPRADGIRTIMLYPMTIRADKKSMNYNAGPDLRMSGSEIAALCSAKFEQAFNATDKFVVLNQDDLTHALEQQKLADELVLAGKALPLELAKAGQILCADYIFLPEFEDLNYTRKIGFDQKAKKFLPQVTMRISFRYRLIDVRTGGQIKNEALSVMIDNQDIQQLPEEGGEKADMLRLLMNKAVAVLSQRVKF